MIKAFLGHSFLKEDKDTIDKFKEYFSSLSKAMDFQWEDAQESQIKSLSDKVKQKMEGKNLFIGIITKKHIEIERDKLLEPGFFNKDKCIARKADCKWGASYWIIQESGYAIAKGMRVLFLIEDGVREFPGLHADIEHIPFVRNKETDSYTNLNTALGNLLKETKGGEVRIKTEEPPRKLEEEAGKIIEERGESFKDAKEKNDKKEEKNEEEYFWDIYTALHKKDEKSFNALKGEVLDKFKGDVAKTIEWKGKILNLESRLLNKNVLDELKALDRKSPDNSSILSWIAFELEKYGSYEEAARKYLDSAKQEKSNPERLIKIGYASEAYAKKRIPGEAIDILLRELKEDLPQEEQAQIYQYLSDSVKILKDDNLFVVFAEKALSLNPSNDSLRFNLAYKYSEVEDDALSLYHYRILIKSNPTGANLNNLAVAYERLKMLSKAVQFYKKASNKDSTISMANLAQQFLEAGFVEEANEQLMRATGYKEYEKDNVGRALARIESMTKEEEEKEKKTLESIESVRQFKLEYAEAYSIPFVVTETIQGKWATRHGEFDIALESGNLLQAEREELIPEGGVGLMGLALEPYLGATLLGGKPQPKENMRKKKIILDGQIIRNRIIEYKIKNEEETSRRTLLDIPTDISGIGFVNKTMNVIKVMERDKDNKTCFYEFVKK
jgi:hypothetical protein